MHLSDSMPGVCHPVAFIPMFREDALTGAIEPRVEMLETKELLMNRVTARFTAWVVPFLADPRFKGSRDEFDRSYMLQESLTGDGVIPFVENHALPAGGAGAVPLYKQAGMHGNEGDQVNAFNRVAYNLTWNHRAKQKSIKLWETSKRELDDMTLAPAFWNHSQFRHTVPDFDQAMIDGEVALNVVSSRLPIKGIGVRGTPYTGVAGLNKESDGLVVEYGPKVYVAESGTSFGGITIDADADGFPDIYAEMEENGITVSLAGLEEARKLQAFAKLRTQFEGHDDDYIIDMLMQGLAIPDQWLKQPFQIADVTVPFTQGKRYATDSGNLDDSATSGFARAGIRLRVPRIETGAVVVVMMEILPEQLWERQKDWFFHARPKGTKPAHTQWPDAERDSLDREKVDVVYNGDIDVSHSDPLAYFGFDPMNAKYNQAPPTFGGKFHKPTAITATDDARRRLYAVEAADPALTTSFMIVEQQPMHIKPFLDEFSAPFEIAARGNCVIDGNTQFGGLLIEQTGNYEAVAEKAPKEQIVKEEEE